MPPPAEGAHRAVRVAAIAALTVGALAACGSTQAGAAAGAAAAFSAALSVHDGAAACALLTDRARDAVESFGRVCSQVIVALPGDAAAPTHVEVWGDSAQVRLAHDVVFLSRFEDRWKVRAAGCHPGPADAPYECDVEG
jgi:hypothetical protein